MPVEGRTDQHHGCQITGALPKTTPWAAPIAPNLPTFGPPANTRDAALTWKVGKFGHVADDRGMMRSLRPPRLPTRPIGVLELRADVTRWLADGTARQMMAGAYGHNITSHGLDTLEREAAHVPSAAAIWADDERCALIAATAPAIPLDAHPPPMPLPHGLLAMATPIELWPGRMDRLVGAYWRGPSLFMLISHEPHLDVLGTFSANVDVDSPVEDRAGWPDDVKAAWRVLATLQTLLAQRIDTAPQMTADRATRRRLEREHPGDDPLDLQVITLVRPHRTSVPAGESTVEWSHRWLVAGHPRQQWCPSRQRHELRIIEAHVKGPPDRPIQVKERLYRWVR